MNKILSEIVINNSLREKYTLSKYACKSYKGIRKRPDLEKTPDRKNVRPIFFHDTDKIIHSSSYSRYIDKTQVFYLFENDHITHRVLHVQFVSKIARVIGRCLKLNEDLIEAIASGHDIGHPPYGHTGEEYLNKLCNKNKIGCFCHNAQSVRCLNELENRGVGLNLTVQVLDGILCHNGEILSEKYEPNYGKKWEGYEKEYKNCLETADASKTIFPMTLEGCVVRIADVVAYIGRDIEDAITLKLIKRKMIPKQAAKILGNTNDKIINTLVMDLINNSYEKSHLMFSKKVFGALKDLKQFNYDKIYLNNKIKSQDTKIERMFDLLFVEYKTHLGNKMKDFSIYKDYLDNMDESYRSNNKERIIVDYIAGMTDDYFNVQFEKLFVPQSYGYGNFGEVYSGIHT